MLKRINKFPKISVVVPSYNKKEFISKTLDSIFCQNYPYLEVIIHDGGSSDGTVEVIKQYSKKYSKVIQWVSEKDKGPVDAVNKGLAKAKGDIITFINADDIYINNPFVKVAKHFLRNKDDLWWVGRSVIINRDGEQITSLVSTYKNFLLKLNKYPILLIVNYITQPAVFLRRVTYEDLGVFTGSKYVMEYDLWLKIARKKMPVVIDEYLAQFRMTTDNLSAKHFKDILRKDYKIASCYTTNPVILVLHYLHNLGRVLALQILKL